MGLGKYPLEFVQEHDGGMWEIDKDGNTWQSKETAMRGLASSFLGEVSLNKQQKQF